MISSRPRVFVLAVVALVAGCASILDISSSDDDGRPAAGGAMHHGGTTSGAPSGAAGEAGEGGTSGSSGMSNGGDGGSAGGSPSPGGRSTGGTGTTHGGAAGDSGEGGGGAMGDPDWPRKDEPCSIPGALSCVEPASVERLVCTGGSWQAAPNCRPSATETPMLCDRRTGTCGERVCERPGPVPNTFCNDNQPYIMMCGPDLVTSENVDCVFGCNGADRCKTPRPNEFVIHNAFDGGPTDPRWPSPLIPVCWTEPNDIELASVRDAIRLKIDSTFGRTTALGFTGWGACLNGEARVELSFVDDCTGERARIQRIGYPGPGESLSVELCKSYYGTAAPAVSKPVEADLLPYLAMHVFGHVVGLEDVAYGQGLTDVMMKAFEWPAPGTYRLKTSDVQKLRAWYGGKPPGSLVTPDGQCLAFNAGTFSLSPCDGRSTQAWELHDGILRHATLQCLQAGPTPGSVEFAGCSNDPSQARISDRISWQTFGDQCVTLTEQILWPLATAPCLAGHGAQIFAFEFEANGVRIRAAENCVVPLEPTLSSKPSLERCSEGDDDLFEVFAGRLGRRGYLLTSGYEGLYFQTNDRPESQDFWLSGAFLLDADALTLKRDTQGVPTLSRTPFRTSPLANQIFDYHF